MELTEQQVVRALKRLEAGWPDHLMLFGGPHNLTLLHKDHAVPFREQDVVEWFSIPASGGDPQ